MPKSKKLPALQFYPGDWRKSMDVQSLSFHDRGVWFEMLMVMHDSERRGVLVLNGRAMADDAIARCIGLDNQTFNQTLTILLTSGVAEREHETGAVMSRRMVRDEKLREIRVESGSKGGNPVLVNQKPTTRDNQKPTPSSSSSSSKPLKQKLATSAFALPDWIEKAAWEGYEEMRRKVRKPMTDRARQMAVRELAGLEARGHPANSVLDQSTQNSWQGLFEIKNTSSNGNYSKGSKFDELHRKIDSGFFDEEVGGHGGTEGSTTSFE
jgi:hypothetical protein